MARLRKAVTAAAVVALLAGILVLLLDRNRGVERPAAAPARRLDHPYPVFEVKLRPPAEEGQGD